jgi:hypothetical protein
MRKKKTEIAPAPVETDFYTEALKAFDVVLPPSQVMRQAEEEKARKRIRRLRAAMLAVVAVTVVILALWSPWEKPPVTGEPGIILPPLSETEIGFHVYTVPNYWQVSYIPYTGSWEFSESLVKPLLERMEALQWHSTLLLSSLPPSPIGDITITRDGQTHTVMFSANGTLLVDSYMARADAALWNDLFSLLQKMTIQTDVGLFCTELLDGSMLYLDIRSDGTFGAMSGTTMNYSGLWSRVGLLLILYTADPQVGFATFQVGDDGGLSYLENHNFWLLRELKLCGPLYPVSVTATKDASMTVHMLRPGDSAVHYGRSQLTQEEYQQALALLGEIRWGDALLSSYIPQMCGSVTIQAKGTNDLNESISLQFSADGWLYDGLRYAKPEDDAWIAFVELLSKTGKSELAYRMYRPAEDGDGILLAFNMDGKFEYRNGDEEISGIYLQLGNLVLLAGPGGLRELLFWDRENGNLTTQTGEVLNQIPILYG